MAQGSDIDLVRKMSSRISTSSNLDTGGSHTFVDDDDWIQVNNGVMK